MVEATMSILLLAGLFLASAEVARMAGLSRAVGDERARALALAQDLLGEIAALPLGNDPILAPAEFTPASRASLTTVYAYSGLLDSPPASRDGTPIEGYSGWSRKVTVRTFDPATMGPSLVPSTGVAQVTVEARRGTRVAARLSIIRTAAWDSALLEPGATQGSMTYSSPSKSTPPTLP